jgi:signal transduction histidine kinase
VLATGFIVAALIFIPFVASFHTRLLTERVDAARLATLATKTAANLQVSDDVAQRLLSQAGVSAVAVKRSVGERVLILGMAAPPAPPRRIDLRTHSLGARALDTVRTLTTSGEGFLLVVDAGAMRDDIDQIEVLLPVAPVRSAVLVFTVRILLVAVLLAVVVSSAIYAALAVMFVRPMRRLARAMARFKEGPEDPTRVIRPSGRDDEIGEAEAALAELQGQVRQSLQEKARLAALGEAVAKINHDLRNVLTNAQLVSDRLAHNPDPQVRAQGERLVRSIDRGVKLAQNVLAYGRAEERPAAIERIKLRGLLEESFLDAASAAPTPTGFDLKVDEGVVVRGDEEFLYRIFVNLMRNAVIAIAGSEGRNAPGTITVESRAVDGFVAVTVADDGPGMPPRALERLFQAFASNGKGAGLGLAIARELARAQGGSLELLRTGPQGTVFEVRLLGA